MSLRLPPSLVAMYRPATDCEVRSWSSGAVREPRVRWAASWRDQRGTLDDQCIFGPVRDFRCACGKYGTVGNRVLGAICNVCGVKITTREARRHRFGHIDLPFSISHPLAETDQRLSAVPVLPAAFWQKSEGFNLDERYDELAKACASGVCKLLACRRASVPEPVVRLSEHLVTRELAGLFESLLPVVALAHENNLAEREVLAHGLALIKRDSGEPIGEALANA